MLKIHKNMLINFKNKQANYFCFKDKMIIELHFFISQIKFL